MNPIEILIVLLEEKQFSNSTHAVIRKSARFVRNVVCDYEVAERLRKFFEGGTNHLHEK